jgi:hypothetical protein
MNEKEKASVMSEKMRPMRQYCQNLNLKEERWEER